MKVWRPFEEARKFARSLKLRNRIRPGITGLWQVNGRQVTTFQQRIKMDIEYVNNRSILFDLKILLKTIPIVFRGKGAF